MQQRRFTLSISGLCAASAAALALALCGTAFAQQPGAGTTPPDAQEPQQQAQPPAPQPGPAPGAAEVSDEQLERFADAYTEVAQLRDEYTQQIIQAEDPDRATELQQEANERMIEAVEEKGLSVGEYNMIAEAMDRDPELQERVLQKLQ
jgi:glucose/arabinose dehydrogenase